ncbi:hypothetical protein SAMN02745664_1244 [Moraxella cuniculi DSM 21768]|uniref:Uncharacterized protein n=1 Tax=Moraxella cuniculi DSM 21768 TaxID=1122245 RepID=A0A1N7G669_9GAMM|nr:hypothetical protein [Moraxella cuniculi]SIS08107.1 hypothetical protein SAMN02745664_1244 [Moraxella cuniculi DSM 21768]
MREFKAGDKVYFPKKSNKVLLLEKNEIVYKVYPFEVCDTVFTVDGKYNTRDALPLIFHATEENHELLEKLYGVEFEAPPVKPTSIEIVQALLARGDKYIPCWVSGSRENPNRHDSWVYIYTISKNRFIDESGRTWQYATPFDHTAGEAITELPE